MSYEAFREQCANICENAEYVRQYGDNEDSINWKYVCAKAIRALPLPEVINNGAIKSKLVANMIRYTCTTKRQAKAIVDGCFDGDSAINISDLEDTRNPYAEIEALRKENERLCELLESAANGLRWYQDEHPEDVDDCDYEMLEQIDTALKGGAA